MKKTIKNIEPIVDKNLNRVGSFIERRPKVNFLFGALFEAFDELLRSSKETAKSPPFIRNQMDVKQYMGGVIVALVFGWVLPAIYFYGFFCVVPKIIVSLVVGVFIVDVLWVILAREPRITEGGFVTCLFIPAFLPPQAPLWLIGVGAGISILFRNILGGVGNNLVNPALLGRLILTICFPSVIVLGWQEPLTTLPTLESLQYGVDAVTHATPLMLYREKGEITSYLSLLLGTGTGSLGETCRIAILISGIWLCRKRIANWRIPVAFLGSVFFFALLFSLLMGETVVPPILQLMSGGLIFAAFFMATDPITTTYNQTSKWIFSVGCGFFTVVIRNFTPMTEGVMYAILIMNLIGIPIQSIVLRIKYR
ncbi:MAG: RnfABCDGE type electron transport complex subunit D [Candidatus Scalindua sp. AMX11]|nr:MAG: RnfABCDGE type electron transport complex subunit D [Candidatus Scalindua sp.]NOG86152.1 RnfABCDGE type electron transport complex subunit D [Planctomycetota bacterium]RZV98912.1 MAG: RnfABCDGE type electron transport complex subunit D [Candidatus Scalindua sp. SCAELEC01]TDE66897.1 MAG: RnfABCDGE type electron transport complex subunit D [Candidatus Scalindua sp. AMX11]GJQ57699.1 MAG: electron transport complex subunit D [Candidatus Scalindua sp.]